MANAKISQLPAVVAVNGIDLAVVVQGGTTSQTSVDDMFKNRTMVAPALGTPASGTLTNCDGLPVSTGVDGLGTGVATALAVNVGTSGSFQPFIAVSAANLGDKTNAINTTGKFAGKQVWDSTANVPLWAAGATDVSDWIDGSGTTVITPA